MSGLQGLAAPAFVPGMFGPPPVFAAGSHPAAGMHGPDFSHLKLGNPMRRTAHHQIYPVLGDDGSVTHLMTIDNRHRSHRAHGRPNDPAAQFPNASTVQHGTYNGRFASFWGFTDNVTMLYHAVKSVAIVAAGIAASVLGG